ncbi:hypothetical protein ERC79_01875 [Rhodococcus sp. ABRD24]|uniref:hypothetical protein n=1 Tax=Rhodococcus sp. ABRD24 TaxID=2507582 RepID=UPI00103DF425|nr:hypothetical protein [Rhodococcus sp. ABRD24]QBJ94851.1 hypothetical protein ERC79_01875 [Rhodococcus sp. ABRD24]
MSSRAWPVVVAGAVLAVVVVGLGVLNPVRPARISTDRLGPDSGEQVADYLGRARASLDDISLEEPDRGEQHWALVSLDAPMTASGLLETVGELRISQVLFQVPIDRVQTPIAAVPVAANPAAVLRAPAVASARLATSGGIGNRQLQIAAYSAARLSEGCACVVGAAVRGTLEQLTGLTAQPTVRAVEALPADAVSGAFAVSPLLPEHTTVVAPGPDDGPVPPLR